MIADKRYITQLTARDLKEISTAVNLVAGIGLKITRSGSETKIEIDQPSLACMMQSYCQQQGIPGAYSKDPRGMTLDLGDL